MEQITEHIFSSNLKFYGQSLESFSPLGGEGITLQVALKETKNSIILGQKTQI